MKKLMLFYFICLLAANPGMVSNKAYALGAYLPENTPQALYSSPVFYIAPGAASITELSNAILQALQANDAEQLAIYLPTDAELTILKQQGSEDMKAVLEDRSVDDLKNSFDTDFKTLIQDGVDKTLNWSEMLVAEAKTGRATTKTRMLYPVELVLQTKQHQLTHLIFETVKVNNRYFLFRGIKLKS